MFGNLFVMGLLFYATFAGLALVLGTLVGLLAKAHRVPEDTAELRQAVSRVGWWSLALAALTGLFGCTDISGLFPGDLANPARIVISVLLFGSGMVVGFVWIADALRAKLWHLVLVGVIRGYVIPGIVAVASLWVAKQSAG